MGCYSAIKKARAGRDGTQETESNNKIRFNGCENKEWHKVGWVRRGWILKDLEEGVDIIFRGGWYIVYYYCIIKCIAKNSQRPNFKS